MRAACALSRLLFRFTPISRTGYRYLNVADQEFRRGALITAQSLRFYKQSTRPQVVPLAELLDSVLSMYAGRLENASASVDRRDRADMPVVCLESEIRQVLNNLIRNSIDAMRVDGERLCVSLAQLRSGAPAQKAFLSWSPIRVPA